MVVPDQVQWRNCRLIEPTLTEVRRLLGEDRFEQWLTSLKQFLCDYFTADQQCRGKLGNSICPIRSGVAQGKGFKVRFAFPGCGKSGGLRLAVLAFCEQRLVKFAGGWRRKTDPDDEQFERAFGQHD